MINKPTGEQVREMKEKDKTKETWSKLNELVETLLENKDKCFRCIYLKEYDEFYPECDHNYSKYYNINPDKRPKECPLRWRYK